MKIKKDLNLIKLGQLIQRERKARRLTQTVLGELSGTSINFISQIEAGKPTAHIGKVLEVLRSLGIELRAERGASGLVIDVSLSPDDLNGEEGK